MSNDTDHTYGNTAWREPHSEPLQKVVTAPDSCEDANSLWANKPALPKEPEIDNLQTDQEPFQAAPLSENSKPSDDPNLWSFHKPEGFSDLLPNQGGHAQPSSFTEKNIHLQLGQHQGQNWPWGCTVIIPLPTSFLTQRPIQSRSAINPLGIEVKTSALQHAFGLNSAASAIAISLRQEKSGTGVLGLDPDETACQVNFCRKDVQWYLEFAQHWEQRRNLSQEEKDRQREHLSELYVNQNQQAIDEWNEFYSSIAEQFSSFEQQQALEDFIHQLNHEPTVEGLTPDEAHQNRSLAKGMDLEMQIGGKLSAEATQGIFLDSLFWTYRQVQEICYFRRSLTSEERDRLERLFLDQPDLPDDRLQLPPEIQGQIDQWAGAEYTILTGQNQTNPDSAIWKTLQCVALMHKYPEIWNQILPDSSAQQIQSRGTVESDEPDEPDEPEPTECREEDISIQTSLTDEGAVATDEDFNEFQHEWVHAAIARLQSNKVRLNHQARSYSQDFSANSRPWIELRSLSQQDQRLVQRRMQLEDQLESLAKENAEIYLLCKDSNAETSDEGKIPDPESQARMEAIQAQCEEIKLHIKLIKQTRIVMMGQFPALGMIDTANVAQAPNTPQTNEDIAETLSKGFSNVRDGIDNLQGQIAQDPGQAVRLSDVRSESSENQNNINNDIKWNEPLGWKEPIGESALTVGGMIERVLAPLAITLLDKPIALGMDNTSTPSDATTDSSTATAITSNPAESIATRTVSETVRVNLVLGYGNILLAGLDAGLSSDDIEALSQLPILQGLAGFLSASDLKCLMRGLKAGREGQMTAGLAAIRPLQKKLPDVYEDLTWLMRQAGKGGDIVYNAEGKSFQRSRPMAFIVDRLGLLQDRLGLGKILKWVSDSTCLDL
jgi:hypothetical protein